MYGRVWRFTPVLTPGLAISIDWNRLSLILIPAWPKTIDQGAELSSGFNDLPAPPSFSSLEGKGRGLLLHPKVEAMRGVKFVAMSTHTPLPTPNHYSRM